jgi:hypothetical protein
VTGGPLAGGIGVHRVGEGVPVTEPHAQDELTQVGAAPDEPVAPPAPANQWTPHDGGLEPAPPARNAAARALRRMAGWNTRSEDRS